MTTLPHVPHPAPANLLRFACVHCGTTLQVPGALAGVSGPCPVCAEEITAPLHSPAAGSNGGAQLFSKPPPRREIPPPLPPVTENTPAAAAVRPIPIVDDPPLENVAATPRFPAPPTARTTAIPPLRGKRPENTATFPSPERGIFEDKADDDDDGDGDDHELHVERRPLTFGRRGWQRWLDITVVGAFCGLGLACLAALRFTEPLAPKVHPGLPENLTERVEQEAGMEKLRRREAGELALASVSRYLGAASEPAAASHLLPPPDGLSPPPFPPFPSTLPAAWELKSSRRIAGSDRYLVVVKPQAQPGPVFVVEQTESGPRLHSGAITQQSAGLFQKFTASPGEGEGTLYVEVRPSQTEYEDNYRRSRPDLAAFRFVDVGSAFPVDALPFIACMKPDSEAARQFARRAHDPAWRPALVQVRWQRHREAGPYVEMVRFLPGPWSGEPVMPPASATTASTSP